MKAKIPVELLHAYDDAKAEMQVIEKEGFFSPLALNLRQAELKAYEAAKAIADVVLKSWAVDSAQQGM